MADMASMSREELEASLVEYRAQLQQVLSWPSRSSSRPCALLMHHWWQQHV